MMPFSVTTGDKQECRDAFLGQIKAKIGTPRHLFMLPSRDAHDATQARKQWPRVRITGVERDPKVFAHICANHPHVMPFQMTVSQYVETFQHVRQPAFDAAFIDYMGVAKAEDIADICTFVSTMAAEKFVLGLTFYEKFRQPEYQEHAMAFIKERGQLPDDDLNSDDKKDWYKPVYLANALCDAIDAGYDPGAGRPRYEGLKSRVKSMEILKTSSYKARDGSDPMTFMLLYIEQFARRSDLAEAA
jgi:hypothetical protein